ncbi:MAG: hypothetical protein P1V20_06365 [Verrucomicrobiales bacterium]|nr:hypothetical protein [Verrucomicrobiales bacterium]
MDQINELKRLRDDAKVRLDSAKRALAHSKDGKLADTLAALIDDLENSPVPPPPPRFDETDETLDELIIRLEFPEGIPAQKEPVSYLEEDTTLEVFLQRLDAMTTD